MEPAEDTPAEAPAADNGPAIPPGFCIAPWVHLHIATNGAAAPCCEYAGRIGSVSDKTIAEIWSGEALDDVRRRFLAGAKLPECWKCFEREATGLNSLRSLLNRRFAHHFANLAQPPAPMPVAFDIRFTNLCNLRCRMCWHGSSSKWFSDAMKLGSQASPEAEIRSFESVGAMLKQLSPALPFLENLYFAGGEPLLMEEHYVLLRMLIERGQTDVQLVYNTNLSVTRFKGNSILDLWNRFPNVRVAASVDAAGAQGELIRKDLDWERFVANAREVQRACPHIDFCYETTVSALNVLYLADMFRELMARCDARPTQFSMHVLQEPRQYRMGALPGAVKRAAARQLTDFLEELRQGPSDKAEVERFARELGKIRASLRERTKRSWARSLRKSLASLDGLRGEDSARTLARLVPNLTFSGRLRSWVSHVAGRA